MWYWHKDGHIDHQIGLSTEINSHVLVNWFLTTVPRQFNGWKDNLSTSGWKDKGSRTNRHLPVKE